MCWGDDNRNYLSPFMGEFERDAETNQLKDFTLYFAAAGPDGVLFTIPYTRDETGADNYLSADRVHARTGHMYSVGQIFLLFDSSCFTFYAIVDP